MKWWGWHLHQRHLNFRSFLAQQGAEHKLGSFSILRPVLGYAETLYPKPGE
jgi:hypothetical protein